jgi:DNA processing protein
MIERQEEFSAVNAECGRRETPSGERGLTRRLTPRDDEYPQLLRQCPDHPPVLYVRGTLRDDDALAVALIGSRRATPYGMAVAEDLAAELAARGVTVISGLARGIDSAAHRGALRGGGRTIAVLGSGTDVIYPPENRQLAAEIEEHGAVLSQFAPGTRPLPYRFPARNYVIAGLALAVVVVEAAERSGALITARLATEMGRDVMAVPGRVTSAQSRGTHGLIRDGAALVQDWRDVVAELPPRWQQCVRALDPTPASVDARADVEAGAIDSPGNGDRRAILEAVGDAPSTVDDVIAKSGLVSRRTAALLLELELDGLVRQIEGGRFVRVERV